MPFILNDKAPWGNRRTGRATGVKRLRRVKRYAGAKAKLMPRPYLNRTLGRSLQVNSWNQTSTPFFPRLSAGGPLGLRHFTKLVYNQSGTLSASTGGIAGTEVNFSLNDCYDPDHTGVGHQPRGFDQLCPALFKRFKVFRADVNIHFENPSSMGGKIYGVAQLKNPSNITVSTAGLLPFDFIERSDAAAIKIVDSHVPSTVTHSFDIRRVSNAFGQYGSFRFDDNFSGDSTGGPGNQVYLALNTCNDTATDNTTLGYRITICYHVLFYDPTNLNSS